jgi:hypothetical protein
MPEAVTLPPWLAAVVALGTVVGLWGFLGKMLVRGGRSDLETALEKKFATIEVLNRWGEKVTAMQKVAETANDQAEAALSIAQRVEQRMDFMEKQIVPRLDKMTDRLTEQGEALAAQTAALRTFMEEHRRNP